MAEENKEVENKADADAGEKLDKVLAHLDSVMSACDSLSKRMDSYDEDKKSKADADEKEAEEKAKADKAKADAEAEGKVEEEETKPVPVAADKAKKDAEEEAEEKAAADAAKVDADDIRRRIDAVEAKLPRMMSDAEHAEMLDAQAHADSVFSAFGKRAPRPLEGETLPRYRRRLATGLKVHSSNWKDTDLSAMVDNNAFAVIEKQVYADALNAANNPTDLPADELRQITRTDPTTGLRTHSFVGQNTFIAGMKRPARHVIGLGLPRN